MHSDNIQVAGTTTLHAIITQNTAT